MEERFEFTPTEREEALKLYGELKQAVGTSLHKDDEEKIRSLLVKQMEQNRLSRDVFGLNPILSSLQTALIMTEEIGLQRDAVVAILLNPAVMNGFITIDEVEKQYGTAVSRILNGLQRIADLYAKTPSIESENFRNLLLS